VDTRVWEEHAAFTFEVYEGCMLLPLRTSKYSYIRN